MRTDEITSTTVASLNRTGYAHSTCSEQTIMWYTCMRARSAVAESTLNNLRINIVPTLLLEQPGVAFKRSAYTKHMHNNALNVKAATEGVLSHYLFNIRSSSSSSSSSSLSVNSAAAVQDTNCKCAMG
eukprot:16665-Heterococcus_DN1.PRE.5